MPAVKDVLLMASPYGLRPAPPTTLEILDVKMHRAWVRYKNIFMNLKSDFLAAYMEQ